MIQFGLMSNIVDDSVWRDLCAILQMIWFRLKCGIVGDCVWTYVQKHYPSDRCPFKKRKQLPKVFLFCKYTTNFGKSLVEGAAITKTRSTRYAFLQICCLCTEHLFWRLHPALCFLKTYFLWPGVLGNPQKNFLELLC